MEIARLVLDYCKALAWPVLVGTLLLAFRARLASMLPQLTGVTAGGFSATFDSSTTQAAALTNASNETAATSRPSIDDLAVLTPTTFVSARDIGDQLRMGHPVLLDLNSMSDTDAKRIVDFCAGLAYLSSGQLEKVRDRMFLITHGLHWQGSLANENPDDPSSSTALQ